MSLGINLIMKLAAEAAKTLYSAGFDIEIEEMHHRRKVDAPSGTALLLADSIKNALEEDIPYVYDRSGRSMARPAAEIGISSLRGGTVVGEHEVVFAGQDEVIRISHSAFSRSIFGKGAVSAAKFLAGKPAGLYTMSDVIG
jgi:4-hydroxy-tetrahydrodipicolinate reductase